MFEIAFNNELLKYIIENFSLQKVSEEFYLNKVQDFQEFLITLYTKGLLPKNTENLILNGDYELKQTKNGFEVLICSWYDQIEWNNFNIDFMPEHGNRKNIISNAEIIAVKDYIKN